MPKGQKLNNNKYSRCTAEEKEARIEKAAIWLYENPDLTYSDFVIWADAAWNVQRNQANLYRKEAMKRMGEVIHENQEAAARQAEASLKKMLKKAVEAEDLTLALKIRQEINKISGLYTQKIDVNANIKSPNSIFKVKLDNDE